ncbi:hypothetical protein CEQ90_20455 [Lewinellaceae bacterium SD302]|nr:hypothetical protein CEQ90_20455 [Lewinellaceae bacterium SD302]
MKDWKDHIDADGAILLGKPVIKGTRLSVEFIVERLADGWTFDEIIENYPNVTQDSIKAIHSYIYDFMKDSKIYHINKKVA